MRLHGAFTFLMLALAHWGYWSFKQCRYEEFASIIVDWCFGGYNALMSNIKASPPLLLLATHMPFNIAMQHWRLEKLKCIVVLKEGMKDFHTLWGSLVVMKRF